MGSSDDETFERPSKRAGRRSNKETREEESERQKTLGSQATIEMTLGRNTRPRAPREEDLPQQVVNDAAGLLELQGFGESH
jgi:hypothetical protein